MPEDSVKIVDKGVQPRTAPSKGSLRVQGMRLARINLVCSYAFVDLPDQRYGQVTAGFEINICATLLLPLCERTRLDRQRYHPLGSFVSCESKSSKEKPQWARPHSRMGERRTKRPQPEYACGRTKGKAGSTLPELLYLCSIDSGQFPRI